MLTVISSRPSAFEGGLAIEMGRNEESVVVAYEESKHLEKLKEEQGGMNLRPRKNVKRAESTSSNQGKEKKTKRSKWALPPLEPISIPDYSIEEVLQEYSEHLYAPPPFTLEEYPMLAIDETKDYSSLVNAFREPLFKNDPSPPLALAYTHRDAAAAERTVLHSKKHEIISRLDEIRRQFAATKAELLNLNAHLKQNSQKVGSWTHKVFELELAERPCTFNEKLERLGMFVERYGVLPGHGKMNYEQLEAAKRALDEEKENDGNNDNMEQMDVVLDDDAALGAPLALKEDGADDSDTKMETIETNLLEGNSDEAAALEVDAGTPNEGEAAPSNELAQSPHQEPNHESAEGEARPELPEAEMHPVGQPLEDTKEQPVKEANDEEANDQSNKENEPEPEPHFTEEETKSLATFISSTKNKMKKEKSLAKLHPHRIRALEEYGVRVFGNENEARFDVMFEKLLKYKKEMGTLRMPSADICKESGDPELLALHNWVFSQIGSFRYQLKTKKVKDVKKFLDIGFSFEKWYGSNGHVFERDIPPFDTMARYYVENGGVVPPEYDELMRGEGKYAGKKRKSLHGPKVKRYPKGPDRRLRATKLAMKEAAEAGNTDEDAPVADGENQPVVKDEDLDCFDDINTEDQPASETPNWDV
jgi:hypothetical protein